VTRREIDHGAPFDGAMARLLALVGEAIAGATHALLADNRATAQLIIDRDAEIDDLARNLSQEVWRTVQEVDADHRAPLVCLLLILPELERSADLAEHVAQRALSGLGPRMTPVARGVVQRMAEVGQEMWVAVATAYHDRPEKPIDLETVDDAMDELQDRLTAEVEAGSMDHATAGQVILLARFYERLGDHAVNLARRMSALPARPS
jgi:phosphate transport system protein